MRYRLLLFKKVAFEVSKYRKIHLYEKVTLREGRGSAQGYAQVTGGGGKKRPKIGLRNLCTAFKTQKTVKISG